MSIITISRGTMSGGRVIAKKLAEELGFRCIDREVVVEKAAACGVSHVDLRKALDKPPTFLDRLQHKKYIYLTLIQAALVEEVKAGKAIYHGTAGHLLLRGGPVFRVRIIAPMEFRVRMTYQRLRYSTEEALAYIRKVDEDWKRWAQYLYGVDLTDPSLCDVIINLEHVDVNNAADAIAHMVRKQPCFEFDAKCKAVMNDLSVASQVKSGLALNRSTNHLEFDVTSNRGNVRIRGRVTDLNLVEEVKRVASATAGVKSVDLQELISMTPA